MISFSLGKLRKPKASPAFAKRTVGSSPELSWIPAEHNNWKVPIVDLQPQTYYTPATPQDPKVIANFQRISRSDGVEFDKCQLRPTKKVTECEIVLPVEGKLLEGILFRPTKLDQRWGIFYRGDKVICVNTWNPELITVAKANQADGALRISSIEGTFQPESKESNQTEPTDKILEFLLRSQNLNESFPAPILPPLNAESPVLDIANQAFENFGDSVEYATNQSVAVPPSKALKAITFLHIAARRGNVAELEKLLKQEGASMNLKDYLGCTPLYHAAFAPSFKEIVDLVVSKKLTNLENPVTENGSTLLMVATETGDLSRVSYLIEKGANVNAKDFNGFTALHRAAEMGHLSLVQYFMKVGASYSSVNNQHTPFSLAALQGQQQVTSFLKGYGFRQ